MQFLIVVCWIAVAAVKFNETLKELFVADNKLTPSDGVQLGSLLKTNHTLALLDLRNNLLQVGHNQNAEVEDIYFKNIHCVSKNVLTKTV